MTTRNDAFPNQGNGFGSPTGQQSDPNKDRIAGSTESGSPMGGSQYGTSPGSGTGSASGMGSQSGSGSQSGMDSGSGSGSQSGGGTGRLAETAKRDLSRAGDE